MIKTSFLTAAFLFAIYNIGIVAIRPWWGVSLHQEQSNLIKAEDFIYDSDITDKLVFAGSSLSTRLSTDDFKVECFSLAFGGRTVYDGLEIIKRSGAKPAMVLIETNVLGAKPDKNFTDKLFTPGMYQLKKFLPGLRQKFFPMSLIIPVFYKIRYEFEKILNALGLSTSVESKQQGRNENLDAGDNQNTFNRMLAVNERSYNIIPVDEMEKNIRLLKQYVEFFKEQNVQLIFFEIPVDEKICKSKKATYIREQLHKNFLPSEFIYIESPDCGLYQTTDGLHLDRQSALAYSSYLSDYLNRHTNVVQ